MEMKPTPFWKSKRFWLNILGIVAAVLPATADFISKNLGETAAFWAVLNILLNFITKDKLTLS